MSLIRLKGLIFSMLVVLYFTTLPIAALISVTTLVLIGSYLSSFEVFTVLLGIMTLRSTFCYNLSICVQMVADAKVAVDRMQSFLTKEPSQFEVTSDINMKNQLSAESFEKSMKIKLKQNRMALELTHFRKIEEPADGAFHTLSSTSMSIPAPTFCSDTFSETSFKTLTDQLTTRSFASQDTTDSISKGPYLSISGASCSWSQDQLTETLRGINFNVFNGDMLAVTGTFGSGKSSLLTTILGELPLSNGAISYQGKMAYVPQLPWVFSGTIRENILFGLPFNQEKFQRVIEVCGLTKDLEDFSNVDLTEIGQRGVTLSGGQKARVGLARAVYSDADIYLLDDPLSAVDTKVGRKLFHSCILGHLSGRIRLLVTHQLHYLKDVDRIAVMENGSISHLGGYTQLKDQGALLGMVEFSETFKGDKPEPAQCTGGDTKVNTTENKEIHDRSTPSKHSEGRYNEAFVDDLDSPKLRNDNGVDNVYVEVLPKTDDGSARDNRQILDLKEEQESKMAGTVTWRLYWDYFKEGLPVPFIIFLAVMSILAQGKNFTLIIYEETSNNNHVNPQTYF